MKKSIALLLALLMCSAMFLAGCGGNDDDVSGTVTDTDTENPDISGTVTPDSGEPDNEPEPEPEPEPTIEIGNIIGGVYENGYFGIGCELDENWTYATEEELASLAGLTVDQIKDEDLKELFENAKTLYDAYASADQGLLSISVVIEDVGVLYGATLDETGYIDLSIENLVLALEQMGCFNVQTEAQDIEFAGGTHRALKVSAQMTSGETTLDVYELIVSVKQGNYFASITLCSFLDDATETMAGYFYAVE